MINSLKKLFLTKEQKRHKHVGNPKYWQLKQKFQLDFLKKAGLSPTDKLLDIGCGTLRGGIPIIKYLEQTNYYGIEVRKEVLDEGFKEALEKNAMDKKPQLILFDNFSDLKIKENFEFVFAFSVLIHMTDDIIEKCFHFVSSHLKPNGSFYANVNLDQSQKGSWQGFPVMHKSKDFYFALAEANDLKMEVKGPLSKFGHNTKDPKQDNQTMLMFTLK